MGNYISDQKELAIDRSFAGGTDLDSSVALRIQYIGSEASATITVASGDFTFKHGDSGSEAVDATIDSGGDDSGVIDISDTNADTIGEMADLINGSANWRCFLEGAVRDDASANLVGTVAATQAKVAGGVAFKFDGSDGIYSVAITGNEFKTLSSNPGYDDGHYKDYGCVNSLAYATATVTETGGATFKVIEAGQDATTSTWNELHSVAIADSTAQSVGSAGNEYNVANFVADENKRLIVRVTAVTSLDSLVQFVVKGACTDLRRGRVIS